MSLAILSSNHHSFSSSTTTATILVFLLTAARISTLLDENRHVITFRSPNLFLEGLAWYPTRQHFLVESLCHRTISVSNASVVKTLISNPSLPKNITTLGRAINSRNNCIPAALDVAKPLPPFNALAGYGLRFGHH